MPRRADPALADRLCRYLFIDGPSSGPELCRHLAISQPTFSRLVAARRGRVLVTGRARATRYALKRVISALPSPIPVFEVGEPGQGPRLLLHLHPIAPSGFWIEPIADEVEPAFIDGFPHFLFDLRPSGFLGRLVPLQHPEIDAPLDINRWSDDDTLRYLAGHGSDLSGNLIAGSTAYERYMEQTLAPRCCVPERERELVYPRAARDVLAFGVPGSSAGGEQPKFLANRGTGEAAVPVIVKFSPPTSTRSGSRVADLLISEHLAHGVLSRHGSPAARSQVLDAGDRLFLEVERFDRHGLRHRRGLVSLLALDLEFVGGKLVSWSESATALRDRGLLDARTVRAILWLEVFGRLIANTDMHFGNLSFFARGLDIVALAPVYDMLPMLYAPQSGNLVERRFEPRIPSPLETPVWSDASRAARELWLEIARDPRVSTEFRAIARSNADSIEELRAAEALLPIRP